MNAARMLPAPAARPAVATAILLLVPAVAMRISDAVVWGPGDFLIAGALIFGTGLAYELVTRTRKNLVYRMAAALALASTLFLVWANLAVGLIGGEGNPANLMYLGVLGVGLVGAVRSRLRPLLLSRTMWAMAAAHALVGLIAMVLGLGDVASSATEIAVVTGLFVVLFGAAALLFQAAARD